MIRGIDGGEIARVRVIGIDDAKFGLFEKLHFGGAIIGESFVIIEVFVSDIGKNGNLDGDAESAELREGVGSGLEDEEFGACVSDSFHSLV